jgi:hypothetical protein
MERIQKRNNNFNKNSCKFDTSVNEIQENYRQKTSKGCSQIISELFGYY